jgi:hypothetical protein
MLYTAHTVGNRDVCEAFPTVRYLKIDVSVSRVVYDTRISECPGNSSNYYPAIMPDGSGNFVAVFNRSDAFSKFVGIYYHTKTDFTPQMLIDGSDIYTRLDSLGRNRWGDYSGIALDPTDSSRIWIFGEYVSAENTWSTRIGTLTTQSASASLAITINLTGCGTCRAGDTFSVDAHITNPTLSPVPLEVKIGVRTPDGLPINLFDRHLEVGLPAEFDQTIQLLSVPLPVGLPVGTWKFEGALLEPQLGETLSRDWKTFSVAE